MDSLANSKFRSFEYIVNLMEPSVFVYCYVINIFLFC